MKGWAVLERELLTQMITFAKNMGHRSRAVRASVKLLQLLALAPIESGNHPPPSSFFAFYFLHHFCTPLFFKGGIVAVPSNLVDQNELSSFSRATRIFSFGGDAIGAMRYS